MSNIDKQALRERYSPKPVPECHICGEEMTIQRMSASRITYGCTGATYDDKGCHYAEGRSIADDHYEQSRVTVVDVSDPDVLALRDDMRQAREQLEAAERRMAEQSAIVAAAEKLVRCKGRYHSELNYRALAALFGVNTPDLPPMDGESRTVMMPEPFKMAKSSSGLMYYYADEVDKALATAGIKVKGE
ncbi:ead/Ea22-like family protein [Salmonella enterica]|nr:ead/Ea22-like family protein [Salmonella enterica]